MTGFSEFYVALRTLLGDNDPYGTFQHQDGALEGALRSVFLLGRGPAGYALDGDRQSSTSITPDIPSGDPFALISYEAALMLVGGEEGSYSYRTRAISRSKSGDRKRDLLSELRIKIYEIRGGGSEQFTSVESFVVWMQSSRNLYEAALGGEPAPFIGLRPTITGNM